MHNYSTLMVWLVKIYMLVPHHIPITNTHTYVKHIHATLSIALLTKLLFYSTSNNQTSLFISFLDTIAQMCNPIGLCVASQPTSAALPRDAAPFCILNILLIQNVPAYLGIWSSSFHIWHALCLWTETTTKRMLVV